MTEPTISIRTARLAIDIAAPGALYRRTRFDWNGMAVQVTLDGQHTFCVPEDDDPRRGTGGVGLSSEFGNQRIFGYNEAQPGELFPKPGIGLLVRPSRADYSFLHDYEIAQLFPAAVDCGEDWACFTVEPVDCRGFAFREIRTLRVTGSSLAMTVTFENTGSRAIHTHEYCHNFLNIDRHPISPEYSLRFAAPVTFKNLLPLMRPLLPRYLRRIIPDFILAALLKRMMKQDVLSVRGSEVTWSAVPDRPFFSHLDSFHATPGMQWTLTHRPTGLTVSESDDFPPAQVVLWGSTHVVSAEVYVDIDLEPGQSQTWTRTYNFEQLAPV